MKALELLLKKEWTMGNGQCGDCCGGHKGWADHPCYGRWDHEAKEYVKSYHRVGHKEDCPTGHAIRELGGDTYFIGELNETTGEFKQ